MGIRVTAFPAVAGVQVIARFLACRGSTGGHVSRINWRTCVANLLAEAPRAAAC
jgi:hypothetical protein